VKVRSLGLAIVGAALLVAATVLGAILVHDGEAKSVDLASMQPGDAVAVKGHPEPFFPDHLALWAPVRPILDNYTYELPAQEGIVVLLTSGAVMPDDVVLAQGTVAYVGPHPTQAGQLLLVLQVDDWREPLLFR
jgi:hypothetical protein